MNPLVEQAQAVLSKNWRDGFTIPTNRLYPFQWNWDSGFISIGLAQYDLKKAMQELNTLFSGQWENGMIPHIIFHSEQEESYFPNWDFWNSEVNRGAPSKPKSSGITQPPVHGFVLEFLLQQHPNHPDLEAFIKDIFPKMVKSHAFFYNHRDPKKEHLFFIYHPWESGRDNSPIWDESLDRIDLTKAEIPAYTRRDTSIADASERPTQEQYDRYVYLLELGKRYAYDGPQIAEESPFLIQDSMMNALLIRSNQSLLKIAQRFGLDAGPIPEWLSEGMENYKHKFWNDQLQTFVGYDMRDEKQVLHKEIGGFIPLFAGLASEAQADQMATYLQNLHNRGYYLCPSFDVDSPLFDSKRYWRGPVWPHMNWMLYQGLLQYGFEELADIVKKDTLELVSQFGFYEYYESEKQKANQLANGYGGDQFSWTASTVIDLLAE